MFQKKEYIYEVYRERSISKAARKLYISQPALSEVVKRTEEKIGAKIFERSVSPLGLTEAGEAYIAALLRIKDIEEEFAGTVKHLNTLQSGHLRIGTNHVFAAFVLPPLLGIYSAKYPGVQISLIEGTVDFLKARLLDGSLDLVLDNWVSGDDSFVWEEVGKEQILLVSGQPEIDKELPLECRLSCKDIKDGKYQKKEFPCVSVKALERGRFLLLGEGNDTRKRADRILKEAGIHPQIVLEVDQMATAYQMVKENRGITFVSDTLVRCGPHRPELQYYKICSPFVKKSMNCLYKRTRYMTRAAEEFLRLVKEKSQAFHCLPC